MAACFGRLNQRPYAVCGRLSLWGDLLIASSKLQKAQRRRVNTTLSKSRGPRRRIPRLDTALEVQSHSTLPPQGHRP